MMQRREGEDAEGTEEGSLGAGAARAARRAEPRPYVSVAPLWATCASF